MISKEPTQRLTESSALGVQCLVSTFLSRVSFNETSSKLDSLSQFTRGFSDALLQAISFMVVWCTSYIPFIAVHI